MDARRRPSKKEFRFKRLIHSVGMSVYMCMSVCYVLIVHAYYYIPIQITVNISFMCVFVWRLHVWKDFNLPWNPDRLSRV